MLIAIRNWPEDSKVVDAGSAKLACGSISTTELVTGHTAKSQLSLPKVAGLGCSEDLPDSHRFS